MTENEHHHEHALKTKYRLHEYEIVRVLGAGGFGITYLGYDLSLDKPVAIKEYLPDDLAVRKPDLSVIAKSSQAKADYAWGLNSFMQEARTLARFQHPNLVQVHRFFEAHGTAYIVMDYVEGETLSAYLNRKGRLNEAELKAILLPLLDGLEEVHKTGYLHRDIKPANIVIRHENRQPVLIDFGAARQLVGAKSKSVTAICTPGYAPIEQYDSHGNLGAWSDIYALGAVSYVALTAQSLDSATDRIVEDELIPAAELAKDQASQTFLRGIDNALKNRPHDRPQSISEWRGMLGEAQASQADVNNRANQTKAGKEKSAKADKPRTATPKFHETTGFKWLVLVYCAIFLVGFYNFYQQTQLIADEKADFKKQIHTRDANGNTPLHTAARNGQTETAFALIQAGVNIEAQRNDGSTPLHTAARYDQTETALALIKVGANIEAQRNDGTTPLHHAAASGHAETVLALIKAGAEIEAQNNDSDTPLHFAASHGQTEIALASIKAGADVNAQTNDGYTSIQISAWHGQAETALALIKAGADVNAQNNNGETPLHNAAWRGKTETALALIKARADVNARNNKGETPAQIAREKGHSATADAIEAARETPTEITKQTNTSDALGNTPLHLAAREGETEKVRDWIQAGANVNVQNHVGVTPLHDAASWGQTETVLALLQAGAEIETQTSWGFTPLHTAAWNGETETALALIQAGADVNARDDKGETPAQFARRNEQTATADAIEAAQ